MRLIFATYLPDTGIEVAFAGRSNAGKSSALNTLTNQKSLARTSKTPGRTQLINLFEVADGKRLVDLPGYGYAEVPGRDEAQMAARARRVPRKTSEPARSGGANGYSPSLKDLDQQMIEWAVDSNIAVLVLLTKSGQTGKRRT